MSEFSKNQIKKAGKRFREGSASRADYDCVHAWRIHHFEPLMSIIHIATEITEAEADSVVVGRLKRFESIVGKLRRSCNAQVTTMGDIAGCRIITTCKSLPAVQGRLENVPGISLFRDYTCGKDSGYRGIHYLYAHRADDGKVFQAEIQLRTWEQHIWATTVETYSNIVGRSLKAGKGQKDENDFFQLASRIMFDGEASAMGDFEKLGRKLKVWDLLQLGVVNSWSIDDNADGSHKSFLLRLYLDEQYGVLTGFASGDMQKAFDEYKRYESENLPNREIVEMTDSGLSGHSEVLDSPERLDVVFTHASSIESLRRALPNYFTDASAFVEQFRKLTEAESLS